MERVEERWKKGRWGEEGERSKWEGGGKRLGGRIGGRGLSEHGEGGCQWLAVDTAAADFSFFRC